MTTPEISKYVLLAEGAANSYTFTEIFNTTGATITPTQGSNKIILTASKATFLEDKTVVYDLCKKTSGVQMLLDSVTTTVVTLGYIQPVADKIYIVVETYNLDGIN